MELGEILEYFYTGPSFNVESGFICISNSNLIRSRVFLKGLKVILQAKVIENFFVFA